MYINTLHLCINNILKSKETAINKSREKKLFKRLIGNFNEFLALQLKVKRDKGGIFKYQIV